MGHAIDRAEMKESVPSFRDGQQLALSVVCQSEEQELLHKYIHDSLAMEQNRFFFN